MTVYYRTIITEVGPDVADLLGGGILIIFAEGAPPELAEVSALHRVVEGPSSTPPPVGSTITVGPVEARLTALGPLAWGKIDDLGHAVINFDGSSVSQRPGEISAAAVAPAALAAAVKPGSSITIFA